jgi:hypothetical protein
MLLTAQAGFGASTGAHAVFDQSNADAAFQPNEVIVSDPNLSFLDGIVDMEFDGLSRFVWVDRTGNVWIGNVDKTTGLFDPPDGRAELVDADAVTVNEIGNGPEWVFTDAGPQVLYAKHIGSTTALAKASYRDGVWHPRFLNQTLDRVGPVGSLDRHDPSAAIAYRGPNYLVDPPSITAQYLRDLADSASEQMIPTTDEYRVAAVRWVPNTKSVIFTRPMPNELWPPRRQVFVYDLEQQQLEQLTADAGTKSAVFMLQAPEYADEYVLVTLIDEKFLGIYRKLDLDGDGIQEWTRVQEIDPPGLDFIWSPEPFVFRGKSYVVMVTSPTDDQRDLTVPTEIWMADLDPANTLYRRLSDDRELVRKDPEVFMSRQGPYVYIQVAADGNSDIYRLDTGLGPQF